MAYPLQAKPSQARPNETYYQMDKSSFTKGGISGIQMPFLARKPGKAFFCLCFKKVFGLWLVTHTSTAKYESQIKYRITNRLSENMPNKKKSWTSCKGEPVTFFRRLFIF